MKQSYYDYGGLDDIFIRNFMMPAIMPNSKINMNSNNNSNMINKNKFLNPSEGFLRGNIEKGTYVPYKNMNFIKPVITNEREKLLYDIQEIAFAAHEINLYLDTHPADANAIKLYGEYNKKERMLNDEYERKYGPIDLSDTEGLFSTPWAWIKEPWPWNE